MKTFSTKKISEIKKWFWATIVLFDEINNVIQEDETIENTNNDDSIIDEPEQKIQVNNEPVIEIIEPTDKTINAVTIEPKINYDSIDITDLSVDQLLQLKVNKFNINNVTIKHLGYNTIDD